MEISTRPGTFAPPLWPDELKPNEYEHIKFTAERVHHQRRLESQPTVGPFSFPPLPFPNPFALPLFISLSLIYSQCVCFGSTICSAASLSVVVFFLSLSLCLHLPLGF